MPIQHQNIIKVLSIDAVVKTTAFTALAGKSYLVSATAASVVVAPPATPAVDDLFAVQHDHDRLRNGENQLSSG